MRRIILTLAAATALTVALPASQVFSHTTHASRAAMTAPYDVQFLDTMAEHHREGIEMFKMAVAKASMPSVKQKAQSMLDMQEKEIPELQALRTSVSASAPQAVNMKLPGIKPMNMAPLENASGMTFDHHFIDMTIKHHEGAITMSEDALKRAKSPELRAKARSMIDAQRKDIADLKALQNQM